MIEPEVEAKQYLSIEVRRRQPKDYIMGKGYMLAGSFPETTHLGTASMEAQHSTAFGKTWSSTMKRAK